MIIGRRSPNSLVRPAFTNRESVSIKPHSCPMLTSFGCEIGPLLAQGPVRMDLSTADVECAMATGPGRPAQMPAGAEQRAAYGAL
jgi:hypothetical protein